MVDLTPNVGIDPSQMALHDMEYPTELPPEELPPSLRSALPTLLRVDLLEYTVLMERSMRLHSAYELERARLVEITNQQKANGEELGVLLDALGTKYNVDFHTHRIQPDGTILPLK